MSDETPRKPMLTKRLDLLKKSLSSSKDSVSDKPAAPSSAPTGAPMPQGADGASTAMPPGPIRDAQIANPSHDAWRDMRKPRQAEVDVVFEDLKSMQRELSTQGRHADDYNELPGWIQYATLELEQFRERMARDFLPQHGHPQLICPRLLFTSRIFAVRSSNLTRLEQVEFDLGMTKSEGLVYSGPELRQGDGHVFQALLNMCRDLRVGKQTSYVVAELCQSLWGTYNGQQRMRLRKSIRRLQKATIQAPSFTVQLVQRFEHPKKGRWSVELDSDIVQIFRNDQLVWLDSGMRRRLPEGLTTWLYSYIRAHVRLIPWSIEDLRTRCGSDAEPRPFRQSLRSALKRLANESVIDQGWFIVENRVHWRKFTGASSTPKNMPPAGSSSPSRSQDTCGAADRSARTGRQRQLTLALTPSSELHNG